MLHSLYIVKPELKLTSDSLVSSFQNDRVEIIGRFPFVSLDAGRPSKHTQTHPFPLL